MSHIFKPLGLIGQNLNTAHKLRVRLWFRLRKLLRRTEITQ